MIFLKPFLLVYTDFIYLIFLFLCYTTENIWFKTVIISLVLFHNFFSHLKVISKNPKYLPLINAQGFWKANEGDFTNGLTFLVENTVYLAEYHTRTRDVGFLGPSKCGGLEERENMHELFCREHLNSVADSRKFKKWSNYNFAQCKLLQCYNYIIIP